MLTGGATIGDPTHCRNIYHVENVFIVKIEELQNICLASNNIEALVCNNQLLLIYIHSLHYTLVTVYTALQFT